jgi:O-antigen/teichoic acid export membrane protein
MKLNLGKKYLPFGTTSLSYNQNLKSLPAFVLGRLMPTLGVSAVFLLMAHKSPSDLAVFAYVLAAASVISAFFSLVLATIGNKAAGLTHNSSAQHDLFKGGFTIAGCLAMVTVVACLIATYLIGQATGVQQIDHSAYWALALIYISSTPVLVINSFLQLFLEATGRAAGHSKTRTLITMCCAGSLAMLLTVVDSDNFKYWAMSYFFISELLTLIFLIRLSDSQHYVSWKHAQEHATYFIRTGVPIAAGMSGQKLYFYLLTERLVRLDAHLVAELSVFMTVVGLLIIPSNAFAQVHSLQVSRQIECSKQYFRAGLFWLFGGSMLISLIIYLIGDYVFLLLGGSVVDYSPQLALTLIMFLVSSSLLSLAFGHLRALNETFVPQLLINVIMLALLIPAIYAIEFNAPDLEDFLMLQSAAAFFGFLILAVRIMVVHKRMHIYSPAADL